MLAKGKRLDSRAFSRLLKNSHNLNHSHFSLRYSLISGSKQRFAVVVPKTISPNSVDRNKLRRRVYEVIKKLENDEPHINAIVFAKKGSDKLKFSDIKSEIEKIFSGVKNRKI